MFTPDSSSLPYSPTFRIARPPTSCNCGSILKVNELYTIIDDLRSRFITFISQSSNTNITLPQLNMSMGITDTDINHSAAPSPTTIKPFHTPYSYHDDTTSTSQSSHQWKCLAIFKIKLPQLQHLNIVQWAPQIFTLSWHPNIDIPFKSPLSLHHTINKWANPSYMVKHDQTFAATSSYSDHLGNHYPTFSTLVPSYHP